MKWVGAQWIISGVFPKHSNSFALLLWWSCPFPMELGWNVGWVGDRYYNSESKRNGMQIGTKGIKNLIITMVLKKNFEKSNSKRHLSIPFY